jgi:hypothetical protein
MSVTSFTFLWKRGKEALAAGTYNNRKDETERSYNRYPKRSSQNMK